MTLETMIRQAAEQMTQAGLHFGHGTDNALDEACWLASAALGMPPDFDSSEFTRVLDPSQCQAVEALLAQRIETRKPLAYLLGRAWLAGLEFEVTPDVLVPRSPLAELIVGGFEPWLSPDQLTQAVDVRNRFGLPGGRPGLSLAAGQGRCGRHQSAGAGTDPAQCGQARCRRSGQRSAQ